MTRGRPDFLDRVQPLPCVLGALQKDISGDGGALVCFSTAVGLQSQLLVGEAPFPGHDGRAAPHTPRGGGMRIAKSGFSWMGTRSPL